nr:DPP IV N-terminal domain-containing protein [uncultured Holophaga sp.]
MKRLLFSTLILSLAGSGLMGGQTPAASHGASLLAELVATRDFTNGFPLKPTLTPDGSALLFLRSGARDRNLALYEMSARTGELRCLFTAAQLQGGAAESISVEERARRERMRETASGLTSYQLSEDGARILIPLSGKVYLADRQTGRVQVLPGQGWIDPQFSPDGKHLAGVIQGQLQVVDLDSLQLRPLSPAGTGDLSYGTAEFAAQEELGRHSGFWWSPDSRRLLLQETDESGVERLHIADPGDPAKAPVAFAYPRAGRANARVRLGLVSLEGGAITWLHWEGGRFPYLARVLWEKGAPLSLVVATRDQREVRVLTVDDPGGDPRVLLAEKDGAWVNLERQGGSPQWLPEGQGLLWMTETRGDTQLELRDPHGQLVRVLTPLGFHCKAVLDVDVPGGSLTVSGGPDSMATALYRVSLAGGEPVRVGEGTGQHSAVFSRDHGSWVETAVTPSGRSMVLHRPGGAALAVPSVAQLPPASPAETFVRVGKERRFDAVLVRPRAFNPRKRYPVILEVYAGPGVKMVTQGRRDSQLAQWMADQGYIVVSLDGRGTPGNGRGWERAISGNLIEVPLADQVEGLKLLGARFPEMDLSRVGVIGASFGGYMAAMATLRHPEVFRCGVDISGVTDWEDYDTCYTERYLGTPASNPDGYRKSNVLSYVDQLQRPLLIIHGVADDNVYFCHALKLSEALLRAGKPFEFLPLPGTHLLGSSDPGLRSRMLEREMEFFRRNLKP